MQLEATLRNVGGNGEAVATVEELVADGLCTVNEAVQFWGVKKSLVYAMMERGDIPYVRIGRRRLIPRRFLMQFAAENLVVRKAGHTIEHMAGADMTVAVGEGVNNR